jgi:hypothetical protein
MPLLKVSPEHPKHFAGSKVQEIQVKEDKIVGYKVILKITFVLEEAV